MALENDPHCPPSSQSLIAQKLKKDRKSEKLLERQVDTVQVEQLNREQLGPMSENDSQSS